MAREITDDEREAWAGEVEGWRSSGLSQVAYCKKTGLDFLKFKYHQKLLRQDQANQNGRDFKAVKVLSAPTEAVSPYCQMIFGKLGRIVIESKAAMNELQMLLK